MYLNTIERLFEGIIQSYDELKELMEDPTGTSLHKPQYEEGLRNRLGRSCDNYLLIMKDMMEALRKLRKDFGVDEQGEVRCDYNTGNALTETLFLHQLLWDSVPSLEGQVKRLKLVLPKNIHTDLFAQIDKAYKQLNKYTKETRILEPARAKRRSPR